jgi:hypothetical protein
VQACQNKLHGMLIFQILSASHSLHQTFRHFSTPCETFQAFLLYVVPHRTILLFVDCQTGRLPSALLGAMLVAMPCFGECWAHAAVMPLAANWECWAQQRRALQLGR